MILQLLLLFLSFIVLYLGAEFSLSSAEKIGKYFGIPSLIVGLLIVGFGTSLPEMFVSHLAAFHNHPEIALGNIVGSNISNIFLILGVTSFLVSFNISDKKLFFQFVLHICLTLILTLVLAQSEFYLLSSLVLLTFFVVYLAVLFNQMKKNREEKQADAKIGVLVFIKLIVGFGLLYIGGELLVNSGSSLGRMFGVSEYVISAILIAFGTSLPELITSIIACVKKYHTDVIIGNIIGSNIFNVALVLGSLGGYNIKIGQVFHVEMGLLIFVSFLFLAMSKFKMKLNKVVGTLFISTYIGICIYWVSIG